MAYRFEKNGEDRDIVISGFEKGIADSPETGLADIRSTNITSIPGEASVSFSTVAGNVPPAQTGTAFTGTSSNSTITVASTAGYYDGMAVSIASTSTVAQVNILLVAGGGGGAGGLNLSNTGGGGGGQVLPESNVPIALGAYPIVVGAGGGTGSGAGVQGGTSSGLGFSATGGLGGIILSGGNSGSGFSGGAGNAGGGDGAGGGGAGNSAVGGTGTQPGGNAQGGNGGAGTANSISGTSVTYGGGGGGGAYGPGGTAGGGTNGGGNGADHTNNATAGAANTGGGGGGAGGNNTPQTNAGAGGTGIVYISYPTGLITATGGTITTSGGNTIHAFSSSGTGTWTVTAINPQAGNVFYIGNLTSTTFKLYYDVTLSHLVTFVSNFTGTLNVQGVATPVFVNTTGLASAIESPEDYLTFMVDNTGNAWMIPLITQAYIGGTVNAGAIQWLGNSMHSATGTGLDFGIAILWGYVHVVIKESIDSLPVASLLDTSIISSKWIYAWTSALSQTSYEHQALVATDDKIYICNASAIASLSQNTGSSFDPTDPSTYTLNTTALLLPSNDVAQCIGQLNDTNSSLLIGGALHYIYPWDKRSTSFTTPLSCADAGIVRIVSTNSNAYIFAGTLGRIYITNGSALQVYQKIPDSLTGNPEPYYTWQDAIYYRNKLHFTFTSTDNSGNILATTGGIWALGIDSGQTVVQLPTAGSLFNSNQFSYGTYGGSCPVLFSIPFSLSQQENAPGYGVGGIWINSGTVGIDIPSSIPYTGFQTYIDTDIIPVGTFFRKKSFEQLEYKLSKLLATGEKIRISYRSNLTEPFKVVWTSTATGKISDQSPVNFEVKQWIQFRIESASVSSSPSFVRLTELRLR